MTSRGTSVCMFMNLIKNDKTEAGPTHHETQSNNAADKTSVAADSMAFEKQACSISLIIRFLTQLVFLPLILHHLIEQLRDGRYRCGACIQALPCTN